MIASTLEFGVIGGVPKEEVGAPEDLTVLDTLPMGGVEGNVVHNSPKKIIDALGDKGSRVGG